MSFIKTTHEEFYCIRKENIRDKQFIYNPSFRFSYIENYLNAINVSEKWLKFILPSLHNWPLYFESACSLFKKTFNAEPYYLLIDSETLEGISHNGLISNSDSFYSKDKLGRFKIIVTPEFVLNVLIAPMGYKGFAIIEDSNEEQNNYRKILINAHRDLEKTRNRLLDYIVGLGLHGELKDVNETLRKDNIILNDWNLGDFKRVDDPNIQHLNELWY